MKYGLIGEKLGHSFSKVIHEEIADYEYEIKEIARDELHSFMCEKDFLCINVTIPYKSDVIPYLDYIDNAAKEIGAVNTIVNKNGKLYGYNTDFGGMRMLILKSGFDYSGKKVLILGTGGSSKTARCVAKNLGAKDIITVGRNSEVNYENVYFLHADADYIINTTPCGMYPDNFSSPIDVSNFHSLKGVTDIVYNPLKTALATECEKLKINCECGLYMLVSQAVIACEVFTGERFDVEAKSNEIFEILKKQKQNIVLVGMPGSGKSTIGKALAEKLNREFVDTDEMIVSAFGDISEIFKNFGEERFREIESEMIKAASKKTGVVIATGGGAVLKKENVDALRQNGVIFFLNRPIEDIVPTKDRPLSNNFEALKKRFEERYEIYLSSADKEVFVDGAVENAVLKIMEMF